LFKFESNALIYKEMLWDFFGGEIICWRSLMAIKGLGTHDHIDDTILTKFEMNSNWMILANLHNDIVQLWHTH
jgi:hypothetical protein